MSQRRVACPHHPVPRKMAHGEGLGSQIPHCSPALAPTPLFSTQQPGTPGNASAGPVPHDSQCQTAPPQAHLLPTRAPHLLRPGFPLLPAPQVQAHLGPRLWLLLLWACSLSLPAPAGPSPRRLLQPAPSQPPAWSCFPCSSAQHPALWPHTPPAPAAAATHRAQVTSSEAQ